MNLLGRILISGVIAFHLAVILIVPNPESVIFRAWDKALTPYANFLGFNTTFRFFSPNPMIQTVTYQAFAFNDAGDITFQRDGRFPGPKDVSSTELKNRGLAAGMFLTAREDLLNSVLKPYLCRINPEADSIYIYKSNQVLPSIEKAKLLGGDREQLSNTEEHVFITFKCKEGG